MSNKHPVPLTEYNHLRDLVDQYAVSYFDDRPEVPDHVYDTLKRNLIQLAEQLNLPDPIKVGAPPAARFGKVKHHKPMLSLKDVFSVEALSKWMLSVLKRLKTERTKFTVEWKYDGLALSLIYVAGELVRVATRGNGIEGEDITERFKAVVGPDSNWLTIPTKEGPFNGELRGEGVVTRAGFRRYNEQRREEGLDEYSSERHLAAAIVRGSLTETWCFRFIPYEMISSLEGCGFRGLDLEEFALEHSLSKEKITLGWCQATKEHPVSETLLKTIHELMQSRTDQNYLMDGLVFKVANGDRCDTLGDNGKVPYWACAYKFPAEGEWSVLRGVRSQVGFSGAITPVADIDPVVLGGVTVTSPTLHNFAEIARLKATMGSKVWVERRGDVIPKITYAESGDGSLESITKPEHCPECDTAVEHRGTHAEPYCPNESCPGRRLAALERAVGLHGLDVRGLGPVALRNLLEAGLVKTFPDLYTLTLEQLVEAAELGEKDGQKVMDSIQRSRRASLDRVIYALCIPGVGSVKAKTLAKECNTYAGLIDRADTYPTYIAAQIHQMADHTECGDDRVIAGQPIASIWNVCITGTFDVTRDELTRMLTEIGCAVSKNITRDTDALVIGEKPSPRKVAAAKPRDLVLVYGECAAHLTETLDLLLNNKVGAR